MVKPICVAMMQKIIVKIIYELPVKGLVLNNSILWYVKADIVVKEPKNPTIKK